MKFRVMSDLHFEQHRDAGKSFIESSQPDDIDVLILAGDICSGYDIFPAIKQFAKKYKHVIHVHGNHEFWNCPREIVQGNSIKLHEEFPNYHWLENDQVEIDGVKFAGSTLFFKEPEEMGPEHFMWSDFVSIPNFREWVYSANKESRKFLEGLAKPDVIITHYLPTYMSVHNNFIGNKLNCFFVCEMEDIIYDSKPKFWIHGHTHNSADYVLHKTRIVCNPFGGIMNLNHEYNDKKDFEL